MATLNIQTVRGLKCGARNADMKGRTRERLSPDGAHDPMQRPHRPAFGLPVFMRWEGHGITCAEKLAGPGDKEARPRRQQRLRADDVLGGRAARSGGHDVDLLTPRT